MRSFKLTRRRDAMHRVSTTGSPVTARCGAFLLPRLLSFILQSFQPSYIAITYPKRHNPEETERAIDEPPVNWNTPDRPGNKGQREYHNTGDHTKLQYPDVSHRIF